MQIDIANKDYTQFLEQLKERVATSRHQAARSVNRELILLYHHIGSEILKRQNKHGWGAKIIDQLSKDLRSAFPEMKGFSTTNLKYMKLCAESFSSSEISQQSADQLPWFHLVTILVSVKTSEERKFYIQKTLHHGWSRTILSVQIETNLYGREGKAITNFRTTLPSPQSDLAHYVVIELKDKDFKPEYAGKMNFYLSAVDDLVKHHSDNPTIGLILCKSNNKVLAEYTLRDMTKPIGLAEYRLNEALPENLQTALPTIEELEAELAKDFKDLQKNGYTEADKGSV